MPSSRPRPLRSLAVLLAGLLAGACRPPAGVPKAAAPPPAPAPAPVRPQGPARPQFTFASWSEAAALIRAGQVLETVSGRGGFALILKDHTWVRPVAKPGDPVPRNPLEFVARNAPNARAIRHSSE